MDPDGMAPRARVEAEAGIRYMPTYEYDCPKCGTFELFQSMSDEALKRCPTCRSKVEKLISGGNFLLKGGGWYADGYEKKSSSSTTESATNGGGTQSSSTESTPPTSATKKSEATTAPSSTPSSD
jgi:putative FmdB family regulatory protein